MQTLLPDSNSRRRLAAVILILSAAFAAASYHAASGRVPAPLVTAGPGITNPPDLFVAQDLVWLGETRLPVDNMETAIVREGSTLALSILAAYEPSCV